jgi:hypothetical protein
MLVSAGRPAPKGISNFAMLMRISLAKYRLIIDPFADTFLYVDKGKDLSERYVQPHH